MQLLDFIFPRSCYVCRQPGSYICPECIGLLPQLTLIPLNNCSDLDGIIKIFKYKDSIKEIIEDLKYNFVSDLASELSITVAAILQKDYPNILNYWRLNDFSLTSIPLHLLRQNWRGFNQSEILAQELSSHINLPYVSTLTRPYYTATQVSQSDKLSRISNVSHAFSVDCHQSLNSRNLIIIDDVITTGATTLAAAKALKSAGADSIWALSLAG